MLNLVCLLVLACCFNGLCCICHCNMLKEMLYLVVNCSTCHATKKPEMDDWEDRSFIKSFCALMILLN
jgi:hypothetical protein